jgi:hypothetical protein
MQKYTSDSNLETDFCIAHAFPLTPLDRVLVRVLDATSFEGSILLESGATAVLSKVSTHYLLLSDVEEYLQIGLLATAGREEEQA